jgi:5-(carboxyamino)imidazole ribonucleotide mutase
VPVATVAINNGKNAGLLAARILAVADDRLAEALEHYRQEEESRVMEEAKRLESQGSAEFLTGQ